MSAIHVRAALETALKAMSPTLPTALENVDFTPPASSLPYQRAYVMPGSPDNSENNASYRQDGIFQVNLFYPTKAGTGAAATRAEMIRAVFPRGATFQAGGITTTIFRTPEIMPGSVDGDRWLLPVRIRFTAQITN